MDFIPAVAEEIKFSKGESSACADIVIIQDIFVEEKEVFEVNLLPNLQDPFAAIIKPGGDRATVTISDGEMDSSMFTNFIVMFLGQF